MVDWSKPYERAETQYEPRSDTDNVCKHCGCQHGSHGQNYSIELRRR